MTTAPDESSGVPHKVPMFGLERSTRIVFQAHMPVSDASGRGVYFPLAKLYLGGRGAPEHASTGLDTDEINNGVLSIVRRVMLRVLTVRTCSQNCPRYT